MSINLQSDNIEKMHKIRDGLSYSIGEPDVSIAELMNAAFIAGNTDFGSWQNLLVAAGVETEADLEKASFDEFIKSHTRFRDWEEMLIHSSNEYLLRHQEE